MKKILVLLMALLLVVSFAACGNGGGADPTPTPAPATPTPANGGDDNGDDNGGDDDGYVMHLGFSPFALGSEYQMMIHDMIVAQAAERNIQLTIMSPEGDIVTQVNQVENMIQMGVDAILIYPVDQTAMEEVLIGARDQGIRVVVNDAMDMNPDSYDVLIMASAIDMGMVANQLLSDWIDENFPDAEPGTVEVAVFGLWLGEYFSLRSDAMVAMPSVNPKAVIVEAFDATAEGFMTEIPNNAHLLIQQHPNIAGILSFTDGFALMVDEVFLQYQDQLDFSRIGHFTVDRGDEALRRIAESVHDTYTIRGTAVPGLNIVAEMLDAVMGLTDHMLDADKIFPVAVIPVSPANVQAVIDGTY
ncbi:MAG: substrate-binding domain-containing protein [Oscillospiraceae bacterium]|nr:substrate-binding domain-containing protein [Oscillospiraceae bacterium]